MLTPADKLASRRNDIIQIEITRKCDLFNCSNCTRLLPFRGIGGLAHDPWEMSLESFRKAVESVAGWPGVVALFGGNPCSHSKFPEVARILAEIIPNQRQRGLWTNNLLGQGVVAREVFWPHGRFNLNCHANEKAAALFDYWLPGIRVVGHEPSRHGPVLLDYRDLGISDEEWIEHREACDINRNWSGAIVQRNGEPVAYFCEVAAALDGARGKDHGVPAVPGWWQRPIADFAGQIAGCCDRGCGVPLRGLGHQDRDDVYDVSTSWLPLPVLQGRVTVEAVSERPQQSHELTDYVGLRKPAI